MERKAQVGLAPGEMTEDVREPGAEFAIVAGDLGVREFAVEIGDELGGVAELDSADALFGGREEHLTEVALADCVADGEPFAPIAIGEGGHAELGRGVFVDAAGRRISGSIQGMSDIRAFLQLMLEGCQAKGVSVFARRDAQQLLEAAQKMRRAERDGASEVGE